MIFVYLLKFSLQAEYNEIRVEIHQTDEFSPSKNLLNQHESSGLENPRQILEKSTFPVRLNDTLDWDTITELSNEQESMQQSLIEHKSPQNTITRTFDERLDLKRRFFKQTTTDWYHMTMIGLGILAGVCILLLFIYVSILLV